jgi:hypothetical protein
MVTIQTFSNPTQAQLAKTLLESSDVPAFLLDENSFALGYGSVLIGIRLQVEDQNVERAKEILKSQENSEPLSDDFIPPDGPTSPPEEDRGYPIWPIVLVIAVLLISVFILTQRRMPLHSKVHPKPMEKVQSTEP